MGLIAELTSLDTGYDCCLTGESAINVIRTALADAERRVWDEAARHAMTDASGMLRGEECWRVATYFQQRAQATQEEG